MWVAPRFCNQAFSNLMRKHSVLSLRKQALPPPYLLLQPCTVMIADISSSCRSVPSVLEAS